ncbi:hypothetical protein [Bradyrhizobium sp. CB3481]|uniref:hypothetical protein n=1 Tax=Bradyrhizobium sp. CB3481 TaxID=3039158 RepID=UPI0024B04EE5|nr:hypothetical protein [Bradyrhizobium sp. CB3481]WFU19958.1 hypothetical protein QA643_17320 [Bradyrhizobium sp. CB3481]
MMVNLTPAQERKARDKVTTFLVDKAGTEHTLGLPQEVSVRRNVGWIVPRNHYDIQPRKLALRILRKLDAGSFPEYSLIATFKPLHAALAQPELFANTVIEWIDQSSPAVKRLVGSLQKQYV